MTATPRCCSVRRGSWRARSDFCRHRAPGVPAGRGGRAQQRRAADDRRRPVRAFPVRRDLRLHNHPGAPVGTFLFGTGAFMAASDTVKITIRGCGGHAARPHLSVDPVLIAGSLVMALQTVVSRNIDPTQTAIVTIGTLHAGVASNVIPESATMGLSVRSFSAEVRVRLQQRITELVTRHAEGYGGSAEVEYVPAIRWSSTAPPRPSWRGRWPSNWSAPSASSHHSGRSPAARTSPTTCDTSRAASCAWATAKAARCCTTRSLTLPTATWPLARPIGPGWWRPTSGPRAGAASAAQAFFAICCSRAQAASMSPTSCAICAATVVSPRMANTLWPAAS